MPGRVDLDVVLLDAVERPKAERAAFVATHCGDDREALAELSRLLRELDDDDPFVRPGGAFEGAFGDDLAVALARAEGLSLGERLGPYQIVEEIGRGGMAVVYLAERADGDFGRQVAIKVVKRGIDTDEVLTRFRQERQILASLAHPGIATLLDGGETPDGRPYLAMEWVPGEPIDRYADRLGLDVDARVDLLAAVASAVQHAHRRLVVHRDLKPSNILVTDEGSVKLLDFGIAKLLDPEVEYAAPPTATAWRVMTPDYASPEQVRREPITTASDVYQLGLVLFELLTGARAQSLDGLSPADVEHVVCVQQPPRASVAAGREGKSRHWVRQLEGDLDKIVLTALQKEPERRYGSVDALIDDLQRYRRGLPVGARGDSFGYLAGKFLKRHRTAMATGAAVVIAVAAIVGYYSARLASERDRARTEAATATRVADFVSGLFRDADPNVTPDPDVTARELLKRGAERVDDELAAEPEVQARLMTTIGQSYRSIGLLPDAIDLHERALATRREHLGPNHPDVAESLTNLAGALYFAGRYADARQHFEEALRIQDSIPDARPEMLSDTLNGLGLALRREGRLDLAAEALERALVLREQALGADHPRNATILNNLGLVYLSSSRPERAGELFSRAAELHARGFGPDSPLVAGSLMNAGDALSRVGRYEEALDKIRQAAAIQERSLGPQHRDTATTFNTMASVLWDMDRYDESIALYERAEEAYRVSLGPDHPYVAYPVQNIGGIHEETGDYTRALAQYERALAIRTAAFGAVHRDVAQTLEKIGTLRVLMADCASAVPVLERAIAMTQETTKPLATGWIATSKSGLGACAAEGGRFEEAEGLLLDAHGIQLELDADDPDTRLTATRLAGLYERWGKPAEAAKYREPRVTSAPGARSEPGLRPAGAREGLRR